MNIPILATKLFIPDIRSELVRRPRLIGKLNDGLQRKLTLISAPAGFGKTTLVSEWVYNLRMSASKEDLIVNRIAWLSLDDGDSDPKCFLTYFITALSSIEGIKTTLGEGALNILHSNQPLLIRDALTSLINEFTAIPDRIILVLDDYHVIESPPVDSALNFLIENLPLQMHLVITTREDPNLILTRLRARGQMTEIRADELRFTIDETAAFLDEVMSLNLSEANVAALEKRTEGWIAGLQLAALSMQGSNDASGFIDNFTGSHRYIIDYLADEVLQQQAPEVRDFLLQTSILNRMTSSLCCAVTAQEKDRTTLERLDAANLFLIPLDNERRWYRYHHLFVDLLRQRLSQTKQEKIPVLHHRASEWYDQNGFTDEAIEHSLCSMDFIMAMHLIERVAETVWSRGEDTKLRRWLDGLPVDLVCTKPQLCIFHAWSLFATGQQDAAERSLQAAEQVLDSATGCVNKTTTKEKGQPPDLDRMKIEGRIAATWAFFAFYRGDVPGMIQYSQRALEYLPEEDLTWRSTATNVLGDACDFKGELVAAYQVRLEALKASKAAGNSYQIIMANLKLAVNLRQQGRLQRVVEICREQFQFANEKGMSQTVIVGWLLAIWGEALAELNDLDEAIIKAEKGVELTEHGGDMAMLGWSYLCLMRVLFSRKDLAGAEEIIRKMENIAREQDLPSWITNIMTAWQARIWLAQGKLDVTSQWVGEHGLSSDNEITVLHEIVYVMFARILIAQGRSEESTILLQRMLEAAGKGGRTTRMIEILMLQALIIQDGGDTTLAMSTFEQALTLAEPGGYIRIFIDECPAIARLLNELIVRKVESDYIIRLRAAFEAEEQKSKEESHLSPAAPVHLLIEPLSPREQEVLRLIAEGLSNQEIGEKLFIALDTVKGHNSRIYGKLGVVNRAQAIIKARSLNILPFQ